MNNRDTLNETAQQLRVALKEHQGRLTVEDRHAVGALIARMQAANSMEGPNSETSPRLSFAALTYALAVLGAYMGAQAAAEK